MTLTGRGNVEKSHARLAVTLSRLTDADARGASLLPGWSVGHVLTHLARNADSHVRMLEGAALGEVADQYPGGNRQRAADIEAGAGRPAAELVADVTSTAARLEAAMGSTPDEAWRGGWGRVVSGIWPLAELPFRRWREVEVHHVDLGLGYAVSDWPEEYVDAELPPSLAGLPARLEPGTAVELRAADTGERWLIPEEVATARRSVTAERRVVLGWLIGRVSDPRFPPLGPWAG